jgi:hypothetical protein
VRTDFTLGSWREWRGGIFAGFACVAVLLTSGCSKPIASRADVAIEYGINPPPVRVGPAVRTVKLRDAAGAPVAGAHVNLEADMSHPGMAPVFGETREVGPGQYQGSLEFAMSGDCVILIHATLPDGRTLERDVNVAGVTTN